MKTRIRKYRDKHRRDQTVKITKPNKMQKLIYIISIAVLVLSTQSCYTIVKSTPHKHVDFAQFPENSHLDDSLTGVYTTKFLWVDYGYQIRKLEIRDDGKCNTTPPTPKRATVKFITALTEPFPIL